jgi:hypothetical protein
VVATVGMAVAVVVDAAAVEVVVAADSHSTGALTMSITAMAIAAMTTIQTPFIDTKVRLL